MSAKNAKRIRKAIREFSWPQQSEKITIEEKTISNPKFDAFTAHREPPVLVFPEKVYEVPVNHGRRIRTKIRNHGGNIQAGIDAHRKPLIKAALAAVMAQKTAEKTRREMAAKKYAESL